MQHTARLFAFVLTALFATGCVTTGEHDALRTAHNEQGVQLARAQERLKARDAEVARKEDENKRLQGDIAKQNKQRAMLERRMKRAEATKRSTQRQLNRSRRDNNRLRTENIRFKKLLRENAKVVHKFSSRDVRAGRMAGLEPRQPIKGKLDPHFERPRKMSGRMELSPGASVLLGGLKVERFDVFLVRRKISSLSMSLFEKDKKAASLRRLAVDLCRASKKPIKWRGSPAFGTFHPRPGVGKHARPDRFETMRASCSFEAGDWSVRVSGRVTTKGTKVKNGHLFIRMRPKSSIRPLPPPPPRHPFHKRPTGKGPKKPSGVLPVPF